MMTNGSAPTAAATEQRVVDGLVTVDAAQLKVDLDDRGVKVIQQVKNAHPSCVIRLLSLSNNLLTCLNPAVCQLSSLTTLRLINNRLTQLPAEIGWLTGLERLELQDNQLVSLPAEIGELVNLTELGLGDNRLASPLSPGLWKLTKLKVLRLSLAFASSSFSSLFALN
jgi:hypothetical protein